MVHVNVKHQANVIEIPSSQIGNKRPIAYISATGIEMLTKEDTTASTPKTQIKRLAAKRFHDFRFKVDKKLKGTVAATSKPIVLVVKVVVMIT